MELGNKTKIYIRADGNSDIGLGHVIRSLALAEILNDDFSCTFATRFVTDYLREEILTVCDNLIELDRTEYHFEQFLQLLQGNEIVVLDNYFYDTNYQQAIKNKGCKLVCIDDIHDKHFVADVVINHAGGMKKEDYSIEPYTNLYLGPQYAILRPEFLQRKSHEDSLSALICFGGADKYNATIEVLHLLKKEQFSHTCHVVIGDAFLHQRELEEYVKTANLSVNIHKNILAQAMADLMSVCSYAICSPSTVSYEYLTRRAGELYLKVIADNQKELYEFYLKNKIGTDYLNFPVQQNYFNQKLILDLFNGQSKENLTQIFYSLWKR